MWAADRKIVNGREIKADALDKWRGTWGENAVKGYRRIGPTSQSHFQGRLKQFCRGCLATCNLDRDPSASLVRISNSDEPTQPLTPAQFQQLLDAVEPFPSSVQTQVRGFTRELTALFLIQRYAGFRILNCLMLPRTALTGNLLSTTTKKTGAKIESRPVPPCVVTALLDLSPDRPTFRPEYFLWTEGRKVWLSQGSRSL